MGTIAFGAAGWVAIDSMNPAADTLARDITRVELKSIPLGKRSVAVWRQLPVFIFHRTEEDIVQVRQESLYGLRNPESDDVRVLKGYEEWLLVLGVCTRLGCVLRGNNPSDPKSNHDWGGWFCPCCGSAYDKSGRVRYGPAPRNLIIPPYRIVDDTYIMVGARPVILNGP